MQTSTLSSLFRGIAIVFILFAGTATAQGLAIASWNIERLGHGSSKNYEALGVVGASFDFIAVQEAMTDEGMVLFHEALENVTGEAWAMMYSHPIGRGSYKEQYGFIWHESTVAYESGAVVYLDRQDLYAREPYSARFVDRTTGDLFVAATVHILYGDGVSDRTPEINELGAYWGWLRQTYDNTPVLLMGDFNLAPTHPAWGALLDRGAIPVITRGATTLSSIDGRYANLYDNIWVARDTRLNIQSAGILRFPDMLGWTHEQGRDHVSDHAPVYVLTHQAQLSGPGNVSVTAQPTAEEVELAPTGPIIGNRNSKIAHRPDCPSYSVVSERNQMLFNTLDDALAGGYRLARNCP